jgi:hypothetical protein
MNDRQLIFLHNHFKDRLSALKTIVLDTMHDKTIVLDTMHDALFLFRLIVFILRVIKLVVDGGACTASLTERRLKKALLLLMVLSS